MELKQYRTIDAQKAAALWNQIVQEGNAFPQDVLLSHEQADTFFCQQSSTILAWEEEALVGLYVLHPNNVGRCGHISNASYAVSSLARGKGIGKALVKHSLQEAKRCGFRALQFNAVVSSNQAAVALYKQLGFEKVGRIKDGFRLKDGKYLDTFIYIFYLYD